MDTEMLYIGRYFGNRQKIGKIIGFLKKTIFLRSIFNGYPKKGILRKLTIRYFGNYQMVKPTGLRSNRTLFGFRAEN